MQVKNLCVEQRIIDVARNVFSEKGYKNARIGDISKKSYITTSNLYTYFDGKQDLFEMVIGDVPILIDEYIEKYYSKAIKKWNMDGRCIEMSNIFPDKLIFNKSVSTVLWILFEGSEGTIYEHYRESLYQILQDCAKIELKDDSDIETASLLSHTFVEKILSIAPKSREGRSVKLWSGASEIYQFEKDEDGKRIELKIFCWPDIKKLGLEGFWRDYVEVIKTINANEYEYVVDCTKIPNISDNVYINEIVTRYYHTHFKAVKYVFRKEQVALAIVFKRLARQIGDNRAEIIFKGLIE